MRVITGSAKGRKLQVLNGDSVRPTTDYVKESIFNIIQFDIEGRNVLDLFAGSGQLGIEALSRGAASAYFVDANPAAVSIVSQNVQDCGFASVSKVVQMEALQFLTSCRMKFDLILLDPPYQSPLLEKVLEEIVRIDILQNGGIIVCESAKRDVIPLPAPYVFKKVYHYGGKAILLYTRQEAEA